MQPEWHKRDGSLLLAIMFAATSHSMSATGTATTEHMVHAAENQTTGAQASWKQRGEIATLGFKSQRRCEGSEITLSGRYHPCEFWQQKNVLGENLKKVHQFTYGSVVCFLGRKNKIKYI